MSNSRTALDKDVMTASDRGGGIAGNIVIILLLAFFAYNQAANTGFFTSSFGPLEAFLFYAAGVVSMIAPTIRAITGRRSSARWVDLGSAIMWSITTIWLLYVFPFNFAHLTDALPAFLRFTLSWVNNQVGWVILLLAAIGSTISAIYYAARIVMDRLARQPSQQVRKELGQEATM
ncbi:MAG TPA: hypothetical protein VFF30_00280 [Nitrososphaerales archaeon]|nr:hypothetical protein [Nitrososphaerales archaeon]